MKIFPKRIPINWKSGFETELANFLLMTIATTTLLALMGSDLLALSLFSARHRLFSQKGGTYFSERQIEKNLCDLSIQEFENLRRIDPKIIYYAIFSPQGPDLAAL